MTEGSFLIKTGTSSSDPDGSPPSFEDTALATPDPDNKLFVETQATLTGIHEDFTSKSPAASRPEIPEEDGRTKGETTAESLFFVPSEYPEVHGEHIFVDPMEAAESVTHKSIDVIEKEFDVGDVEIVLEDIEEEQGFPEDDGIPGITSEVLIPPEPELIEEVTPHGEEPPSESVAEEVFTEATVMVLVKPTVVYPTETGMLEDVSLETTIAQEVGETADNSFDISKNVEVTVVVQEEPTAIAEEPSDPLDSANVTVLTDADVEIQVPVEPPPETPSGDKIEVGTEVSPTVFLTTSHGTVEAELEHVIEVEPLSQEEFVVTVQDDKGKDLAEPEIDREITTESAVKVTTVTAVFESTTQEVKEEDTAVIEGIDIDTEKERLTKEKEETVSTAEQATESSLQLTTGAVTDDEAVKMVQATTEVTVEIEQSLVVNVRPLEIPAESLSDSAKEMQLLKETTHEAEDGHQLQEQAVIPPVQEAGSVKEVDGEETPTIVTLIEPVETSKQNESDVDMTPLENTDLLTVEQLDKQEEAGTMEIITESTSASVLDQEETHMQVLDELITETFDITTIEPHDMITPIIAVFPDDDALFTNTGVDKLPDHEVNIYFSEVTESGLQPGATAGPLEVVDSKKEDSDREYISRVEEDKPKEIPDSVTQRAVTHPLTTAKIEAIEPDKTQDGPPTDHVIPTEESVLQDVTVIPPDAESKDAAGTITVAPVVVTSESFVKSTSGNEQVSTENAPEEPTTIAPAEPTTKYVVEYNNGNFPDKTESPYFVDENLLGNNGFELDEDENLVRTLDRKFCNIRSCFYTGT